MRKASKACLFLFIFIYNYIYLRSILFYSLYNEMKEFGLIFLLIILALILILFFIIPKAFYKFDFYNKINNSKLKYLFTIFLSIRTILGIALASYLLSNYFYKDIPFYFILIILLAAVIFLSSFKPIAIIEISSILGIIIILLYLLYFHIPIEMNFINNSSFSILPFFYSIFFIFDNFIYLFSNKDNLEFKKSTIILGIIFSLILLITEYGLIIFTSSSSLFINNPIVGFLSFRIAPISRFYGSFDYIYITSITITAIIKLAFYNSIITYSKRIRVILSFILLILSILIYFLIKLNYNNYLYFNFITGILMIGIVIYMIGAYYEIRKNK